MDLLQCLTILNQRIINVYIHYKVLQHFFQQAIVRWLQIIKLWKIWYFKICYLLEKRRERSKKCRQERDPHRKVFQFLLHSPKVHNSWGWSRSKSGTRNSTHVSHRDDRGLHTWTFTCCLQVRIYRKLEWNQPIEWEKSFIASIPDQGLISNHNI